MSGVVPAALDRPEAAATVRRGAECLARLTRSARMNGLSADPLVMGAYALSPLRELILGGVTRHMLDHADVCVLMRH